MAQFLPEKLEIPTGVIRISRDKHPTMAQCMCGVIYDCINGWAIYPKCSKDGTFVVNKWERMEHTLEED